MSKLSYGICHQTCPSLPCSSSSERKNLLSRYTITTAGYHLGVPSWEYYLEYRGLALESGRRSSKQSRNAFFTSNGMVFCCWFDRINVEFLHNIDISPNCIFRPDKIKLQFRVNFTEYLFSCGIKICLFLITSDQGEALLCTLPSIHDIPHHY